MVYDAIEGKRPKLSRFYPLIRLRAPTYGWYFTCAAVSIILAFSTPRFSPIFVRFWLDFRQKFFEFLHLLFLPARACYNKENYPSKPLKLPSLTFVAHHFTVISRFHCVILHKSRCFRPSAIYIT